MRATLFSVFLAFSAWAQTPTERDLDLDLNKALVLENVHGVKRVATANPEIAEAVAVSPTEIMVNGKAPGETSLVLWDGAGARSIFNVHVRAADNRFDMVNEELRREFPNQDISFRAENGAVMLRGTVADGVAADRAVAIASVMGKVVNLLRVAVPPAEPQILLHVKFANVDRSATTQLGLNLISTGALNTPGSISTGQFAPPYASQVPGSTFTVADAFNLFFYRPDLNLGGTLAALVSKQLAEILAEPNLLTLSGHAASFLAGGEFPFPTLQGGGSGVGQITIQFREFGVRIHFLPVVTPRGTIRMTVTPEVSSLDFANGLTVDGFTVPGLAIRRVETQVELGNGQSFVIGGLLDDRLNETIDKIPGLGDIPLLGKLFQSKARTRNHSELLVIVTPEIVRPIEPGEAPPDIPFPGEFLPGGVKSAPHNPAVSTSEVNLPKIETLPVELLHDNSLFGVAPVQQVPMTAPAAPPVLHAPSAPLASSSPAAATSSSPR